MVADATTGVVRATAVTVAVDSNGIPTAAGLATLQNANITHFRYDFTGTWAPGAAVITFAQDAAHGWADSNGDQAPLQAYTFQVLGPTAVLVQPHDGSSVDINSINGRTYLDVTLPTPPSGYTIDWSQITALTPILTLAGPGVGTAQIDRTQAPVILSQTPGQANVRYWISGVFGTGEVDATFIPGAPPLKTTLTTTVDNGPQTIDVLFPVDSGQSLVASSLTEFNEFQLGGSGLGTVAIDTNFAPVVQGDGKTVRYHVTGDWNPAGGAVTATFTRGTWSTGSGVDTGTDTGPFTLGTIVPGQVPSFAIDTFTTGVPTTDQGAQTIDILFPVASGYKLDATTILTSGQFVLSGDGLGTLQIDPTAHPQVLADGMTVRFKVTGSLNQAGGTVIATFTRGTWSVKPVNGGASVVDLSTVSLGTHPTGSTLDIAFPVAGGFELDPASITAGQVTLSGDGIGTLAIDPNFAPQVQGDGVTVRIHVTGASLTTGTVTAAIRRGFKVEPTGTTTSRGRDDDGDARHLQRRPDPGIRRRSPDDRRRLPGAGRAVRSIRRRSPASTRSCSAARGSAPSRSTRASRRCSPRTGRPSRTGSAARSPTPAPSPPRSTRAPGRTPTRPAALSKPYTVQTNDTLASVAAAPGDVGLPAAAAQPRRDDADRRPADPAPGRDDRRHAERGAQLPRHPVHPDRRLVADRDDRHERDHAQRHERHGRLAVAHVARRRRLPLLPERLVLDRHRHGQHPQGHVLRHALLERRRDGDVHGARPDRDGRDPGDGAVIGANGLDTGATSTSRSWRRAARRSTSRRSTATSSRSPATPAHDRHDEGAGAGLRRAATPGSSATGRSASFTGSGTPTITFNVGGYGFTDHTMNTFTGPVAPVNFTRRRRRDAEHPLDRRPADADRRRLARPRDDHRPERRAARSAGAGATGVQLAPPPRRRSCPARRSSASTSAARSRRARRRSPHRELVHLANGDATATSPTTAAQLHDPAADRRPRRPDGGDDRERPDDQRPRLRRRHVHAPDLRRALDVASVTDLAPEFTIAPASGTGTIALDATQAPRPRVPGERRPTRSATSHRHAATRPT